MADIIERLRIESRREPHEPIWRDAIDEIEALRAEVAETREFREKMANAIGNDQLRRFIEKHGEPVPLTLRVQAAEARAERLAEALRIAEAALADIGDADREPGDDVAWCERRAAQALPMVRALLRDLEKENEQ